jgi:hypothetical protein
MVDGGAGYAGVPTVTLSGGTPARTAVAAAIISNGRVEGVAIRDPGEGYQAAPSVVFSGGIGKGASFSVGVQGQVVDVSVISAGQGYTSVGSSAAAVTVSSSNGLTEFESRVLIDRSGKVAQVIVLNAGTGATAPPTLQLVGAGTGATLRPVVAYAVAALSVTAGGSGYQTPPFITIQPDPRDSFGGGAVAESVVSASGAVQSATVVAGGRYTLPPTALIIDSSARAQATLSEAVQGTYLCAIRYIDNTDTLDPTKARSPRPSSISELKEVDTGDGSAGISWTFTDPYVDDRVVAMELWRTTRDQSVILFRVATITKDSPLWDGVYFDALTDEALTDASRVGYGLMPITLPSGQINARRFEVPPGQMTVGVMFQDRAWYAGDSIGASVNSLYYSEIDEPESVPAANELVVQESTGNPDAMVALVPLGSALLLVQSQHIYKLMYVAQPVIDAAIMLVAYRGVLNNRCWDVMAGVAFFVDSIGMYAFDGNQEQAISAPVDDLWRNGTIDFSKSDKFHVASDHLTRTVRFYYCRANDAEPTRALCYCSATQAWWEEVYPDAVTAAVFVSLSGQRRQASGTAGGAWLKEAGTTDGGNAIAYRVRTGNFALTDEPDRAVDVIYEPTQSPAALNLGLHYNSSGTARPNAVQSDRGAGFTVTPGGPASLNMQKARAPAGGGAALGEATGQARAYFAGRRDDRSAGGDRHVAVELSGEQSQDAVTLYALGVRGVQ